MLYAYVKNLVELVELHHTLTSWLCLCLARKLEIAWDPLPLQEVRAGVQVSSWEQVLPSQLCRQHMHSFVITLPALCVGEGVCLRLWLSLSEWLIPTQELLCGEEYVGETECVRERIQEHYREVRACAPQKPWGEHCALHQPLQHPSTAPFIFSHHHPYSQRKCHTLVGVRDARTVFVGWVLFHVALNAARRTRPSASPHLKRRGGRGALAGFYGIWSELIRVNYCTDMPTEALSVVVSFVCGPPWRRLKVIIIKCGALTPLLTPHTTILSTFIDLRLKINKSK